MYYYGPGCIDSFNGLVELEDFIKGEGANNIEYLKKWIKEILTEAFFQLPSWDDKKTPWIYIGRIPSCRLLEMNLFLVWKQSDNGLTFMAFPFALSSFKGDEIPRKLSYQNIKMCTDLITNIIDEQFNNEIS